MSEHELNDNEYLHEIECVEERVRAEERENLHRQIDWLAKALARYADACPLEISLLNDGDIEITKISNCDGSWPADDYFYCSEYNPEKCWKEAARRAVEEEDDAE